MDKNSCCMCMYMYMYNFLLITVDVLANSIIIPSNVLRTRLCKFSLIPRQQLYESESPLLGIINIIDDIYLIYIHDAKSELMTIPY